MVTGGGSEVRAPQLTSKVHTTNHCALPSLQCCFKESPRKSKLRSQSWEKQMGRK